jgi:DNA-binding NtrC family response regulator
VQLLVTPAAGALTVERLGRLAVRVNGALKQNAELKPGDTLLLGSQILLICTRRTARIVPLKRLPRSKVRAFGEPDAFGMIGESPTTWELRESIAFAALSQQHCLVLGESGTGKELAARMIHELGVGASRAMVSRNAATFPEALVDAELFGNICDYPNPGMPGRPGLVGACDGSSLFLDEIAEFPEALQAHLLRVLDSGGEYQRLGDAETRRSSFRLICATNRGPQDLRHDLVARLKIHIRIPTLKERSEDVPLLARSMLRNMARRNPEIAGKFLDHAAPEGGQPRMEPDLVDRLVRHTYRHHAREMESLLWLAVRESTNDTVEATPGVLSALRDTSPARTEEVTPTPEEVRAALERHGGNQSRAFRDLGLKNRHALIRLMKRFGVERAATS